MNANDETEFWDVYDGDGNPTGRTIKRGDTLQNGEYHLVSSLMVVNNNGEILIQKRSETKEINPGTWSITGGAARAGEKSEEACVREVYEEIGYVFDPGEIELLYRYFHEDNIFDDFIAIRDLDLNEAVLQADEVSELKWANVDEIKKLYNSGQFMFGDINLFDKTTAYINDNLN